MLIQMNKSIKSLALFMVLVLVLASCKSKKALVDAQPEPEPMEEPAPTLELEPEPEPEPRDVRSAPEATLDTRLNNYFAAIASASSNDVANRNIREALGLFSNGTAPVLIIIYAANGTEDYDEPTDITKYLNYIKDTGNNVHRVKEVVRDPSGKIKELVLVKK